MAAKTAVRDKLADAFTEDWEAVRAALRDAIGATKRDWLSCPNCRKRVQVDRPDTNARIKAIEMWIDQGFGRPGAATVTDNGGELEGDINGMDDEALASFAAGIAASDPVAPSPEHTPAG